MHLATVSAAMTSSRLYENGITEFPEEGRRGSMLAMPAMLCLPAAAMGSTEKGAGGGAHGKCQAEVKETVYVGKGNDEKLKASTRTVVVRPGLPAVMAAAPKRPMVVSLR